MSEKGDLRYLLVEYDENYDPVKLVPVYEDILKEYQELTGDKKYDKYFDEVDTTLYKTQLLNGISLCVEFICWGMNDDARDIINELNIRYNGKRIEINESSLIDKKAIGLLQSLSKTYESQLIIKAENQKREQETDKKQISWADMRVSIHTALSILPEYDCSVEMCLSYQETIKRQNIALKEAEAKRNGNRTKRS